MTKAATTAPKNDGSNLEEIKDLLKEDTATTQPAVQVNIGDTCRISAVHGLMINPLTEDRFDIGSDKKVVVDAWLLLQINAGKMTVSE